MTPERLAQLRLTAADTTDAPCDEHCAAARRGDVRDLLAEVDMLTRLLVLPAVRGMTTPPRRLPIVESCTRCYYCARWGTAPHYECVHPMMDGCGSPWFLDAAEAESGVPQECPLRRETRT